MHFREKLENNLTKEYLSIQKFYFLSETFYNQKDDDIRYIKIKLLIQHLLGYKTNINKFTNEEIERYDIVNFYDNQYDTIKICDEINVILKSILDNTDDGIRSAIKEDILDNQPSLIVNQVSDNQLNRIISKKVNLEYSNLIKTFESFNNFL